MKNDKKDRGLSSDAHIEEIIETVMLHKETVREHEYELRKAREEQRQAEVEAIGDLAQNGRYDLLKLDMVAIQRPFKKRNQE